MPRNGDRRWFTCISIERAHIPLMRRWLLWENVEKLFSSWNICGLIRYFMALNIMYFTWIGNIYRQEITGTVVTALIYFHIIQPSVVHLYGMISTINYEAHVERGMIKAGQRAYSSCVAYMDALSESWRWLRIDAINCASARHVGYRRFRYIVK